MPRVDFSIATLASLVVACAGDDAGGTSPRDAGTLDGATCPAKAPTCPTGCAPLEVMAIDEANQCLSTPVVVGCWDGVGGANALAGCIKDAVSGTKYLTPTTTYIKELVSSGEWELCTTSVSQACP